MVRLQFYFYIKARKEPHMTILQTDVLLLPLKRSALLFSFILIFLMAENSTGQVVDRVVAVVNDDVILLSDLENSGKAYFQKVKDNTPEGSRQDALQKARDQVLNGLIEDSLISQKAKKEKISVSDDDVKRTYEQILERSGLTENQFMDKVKESGFTKETYEKQLRNQILQDKLINYNVRSKVVVTDTMVKQYYDGHSTEQSIIKGGYALLQMGFTWGQGPESKKSAPNMYADKVDAKKRAVQVHKFAQEGQDFRELAKKYSNLPSAADGGDIGIFKEEDMAADMRDAVVHLKPGEISTIIETPAGFQFFKLIANKEGVEPQSSYESAKSGIKDLLYEQQLKEEFNNWVKNLKEQAYIRKM
jgi:peptidyl-prolyl cis-trans isomerase SurA